MAAPPDPPPLNLPPPYNSLPRLLRHHRLPLRHLLAAHALAAVAGHLSLPDSRPHTLLLVSYSRLARPLPAALLLLFRSSLRLSVAPTRHSLPLAISAASSAGRRYLPLALCLHAVAVARNLLLFPHVANALVSLYARHALPDYARRVFDGMPAPDVVSYNALVHGYIRAGRLALAREVFEGMPVRDATSWGTVVAGCAKAGRLEEAVALFDKMTEEGFTPDDVALAAMLSCCAQLGALEKGREVHEYVKQSKPRPNVFLCTGLVHLYAKCGCVEAAIEVFEACPERNVFTWNALVVGLAMHGHGTVALEYFDRMLAEGIQPDGVTFLGVLIGCSHASLVGMARRVFCEMEGVHNVPRELKHYGCMADLLGRAGLIEEAMDMVRTMPMEGDTYVWGGILAGCRIHQNVEAAEVAARHLLELNPDDSGVYSAMAGIYADAGRWDDVAEIRKLMDERIHRRNVGCSSVMTDQKDGIC
ncbi:pentatricopeptide repeat-containing protein At5g61800-like [Phragmites australis]|uniref:pentatricopeptide repeat-containing protein At5g61800-like n=1 Tax=Phragmites australis TaxID=29695 RepID=UPI002D7879AF|nr:pentatricopeptide repeat-containing protein At5g61800-like [Phragmites australis]XP_062186250.1 pentatricopeptide repeat-containing protein At5g61800-like [Phragmites australis]